MEDFTIADAIEVQTETLVDWKQMLKKSVTNDRQAI
jgi:hypothetical protein